MSDPSQAEAALGFSYSWSVTKDGSPYTMPGNPATNLASFTFHPTAAGTYVINLAVTDHNNEVGVCHDELHDLRGLDVGEWFDVRGRSFGSTSLTATVTSAGGIPAGSVDFYDSTTMTDLGSATLNSAGTATLNLSVPLEAGPQSIVLTFTSSTTDFSSTQHDDQRERSRPRSTS